jgi:hypothetical protein
MSIFSMAEGVGDIIFGSSGHDDEKAEQDRQRQQQQQQADDDKKEKQEKEDEQRSKDADAASSSAAFVASSLSAQAACIASSASSKAASVASSISAQAASVASSISAQAASLSSAQAQFSPQAQSQAVAVAASPVVAAPQQPAHVTVYATIAQGPAVATASAVQQLNSVVGAPLGDSTIAGAAPVEESAAVIAPPAEKPAAHATSPMQEQAMVPANGSSAVKLRRRAGPRRQNTSTASLSIWRVVSTLGAFSTTIFAAVPRNIARSIDASPNSQSTPVQIVGAVSVEPAIASMASVPSQVPSGLVDIGSAISGTFDDFDFPDEMLNITTSDSVPKAPNDDHDTPSPTSRDDAPVKYGDHGSNFLPRCANYIGDSGPQKNAESSEGKGQAQEGSQQRRELCPKSVCTGFQASQLW